MKPPFARLGAGLIRALGASVRVTCDDHAGIINHPDHPPVIIAFWHSRMVLMAAFYEKYCQGRRALTFISRSRDGQLITDIAAGLGIGAVRGSSSRHGTAAALAAIHASNDPLIDLVITPDGPRGPRHHIQPGLIRLAQATGRPVIAVSYRLSPKIELRSWDRFHVPLPFSKCHLVTHAPIAIPKDASAERIEEVRTEISRALGED